MVIYADTSFLFSLYGNDAHSEKALAFAGEATGPISVLELTLFELENALRFSAARGFTPAQQCEKSLDLLQTAVESKRILTLVCNLANVVARARRISKSETPQGAHRAFDILHVAMALEMDAEHFLTFDDNQATLARAQGLVVPA